MIPREDIKALVENSFNNHSYMSTELNIDEIENILAHAALKFNRAIEDIWESVKKVCYERRNYSVLHAIWDMGGECIQFPAYLCKPGESVSFKSVPKPVVPELGTRPNVAYKCPTVEPRPIATGLGLVNIQPKPIRKLL